MPRYNLITLTNDYCSYYPKKDIMGMFKKEVKKTPEGGDLVIDVAGVNIMSSSSLGTLLFYYGKLKEEDKDLVLVGVQEYVGKILDIVAKPKIILKTYDTFDDYLADNK